MIKQSLLFAAVLLAPFGCEAPEQIAYAQTVAPPATATQGRETPIFSIAPVSPTIAVPQISRLERA